MDNKFNLFNNLTTGSSEEFSKTLDKFLAYSQNQQKFDELNNDNLRVTVWETLFTYLTNRIHSSLHEKCLIALRILSRDKTSLESLITKERLDIILQNANLAKICDDEYVANVNIIVEALKLLCNLLFNCMKVQQLLPDTLCLPLIIDRINTYNEDTTHDMKIFDVRVLFLASALNVSVRGIIRKELNGDVCLINILNNIVTREPEEKLLIQNNDAELACEVLQVLFNLCINIDNLTDDEIDKYKNLVTILRKLLVCKCSHKQQELHSHVINLLVVMPYESYSNITHPVLKKRKEHVYENLDMRAIFVLLKFLDRKLDYQTNLIDNLSPIVTALLRIVKVERFVRKYIRLQVLPPLKDVMKRPEEGNTLRAKLCKFLTSPITELRDLIAEFLFVLCKENVGRMIKYTGYGNAAGMFANKGLLGKNQPKTCYSSESEESDTEEYSKYKEQINPVIGCYEAPKPDPLAGMTEEQKEYEALKLVGLVDQLTREGVVQPCRIGEDGKPKPIEHVLELQEELPKQQVHRPDVDSD